VETAIYKKHSGGKVECGICHHRCFLKDGAVGICKVRKNINGSLQSLVYEKIIAKSVDPIEKKPFFHVAPGSLSYSIATVGCNFSCRFCQNSNIAQMPADNKGLIMGDVTPPFSIIKDAVNRKCKTIAYTYTEPAVFFEYLLETAKLAKHEGIGNVIVSNGYMTSEAVDMISPYIDAANIDLKSFSDDFYKNYCGSRLEPVKNTLRKMKAAGVFLEITTLLIPGLNDDLEEIDSMAAFIAKDIGVETPWHISRFHPSYRLTNIRSTPVESLLKAREIGFKNGLKHVYAGNIQGEGGENTYCHQCNSLLIERLGYTILNNRIEGGCCNVCNAKIHGVDL